MDFFGLLVSVVLSAVFGVAGLIGIAAGFYLLYQSILSSTWYETWRVTVRRRRQQDIFDFNKKYVHADVYRTTCCGACELFDLEHGPLDALAALAKWQRGGARGNFKPLVFFTDNSYEGNGSDLAAYIRRHRLGSVVQVPYVYNPNSGNNVRGWIWRINRQAWERWIRRTIVWSKDENE